MRIKGSVAVVTGASGGIGRASALALGRAGAAVGLVGRSEARLEQVRSDLTALGVQAVIAPSDVRDPAAVAAAHAAIASALGPIDILVHAAGLGIWKPFLDVTAEEHRAMMDTMYWGGFHWARELLPGLRARGRGHLVFVSAGSGRFALPVTSGYSAAAFALTGLAESLHRELLGSGSGVSCLNPGSVRTEFWNEANIPAAGLPPLVRYAPRLSPAAVARNVLLCIRLGLASRTLPVFVAFLARVNALWIRLGDLLLWRWFVPALMALLAIRLLFRFLG
jgi:short-subunit dehydrogenase